MNKIKYALLIIMLSSCSNRKIAGLEGYSENIKESKKQNVFIAEYKLVPNPCKINDTTILDIDEIWVEKYWYYGKEYGEIDICDTCAYKTIIFKKKSQFWKNDYPSYTIIPADVDGSLPYRSYVMCSVTKFDLAKDTLFFRIKDLSYAVDDTSGHAILGRIMVVKK